MNIGVPREQTSVAFENRVGLAPDGVAILCAAGHVVYVQSKAGANSGFSDEDYRAAGAAIVYSAEEAWGRADMVAKVRAPVAAEFSFLRDSQIVTGFLHMAVAPRALVDALLERRVTAIAYETIQADDGRLPVVLPMSEIAGRMIPYIAGELLMNTHGGKGILLGSVPGITAPEVVIVGAGVVGCNAARSFLGLGAQVTLLDAEPQRLRVADEHLGGRASLTLLTPRNLGRACAIADVLVTCVLIPGERTPKLVTREMVRSMKPGSVIMDISIDQGGCVETSRPTTHQDPTFVEENVIHYCVPNMSSGIARTASLALTYAVLPYLQQIACCGVAEAVRQDPALGKGIMVAQGEVASAAVAGAFGLRLRALSALLAENRPHRVGEP